MSDEAFTPYKLRRVGGDVVAEGAFLVAATIAYRVDRVRGDSLFCTSWPTDEIPEDARVFAWKWGPP